MPQLKGTENIPLNNTDINRPIEIYRLENIEDVTLFGNYRRYDFFQLLWLIEVGGNSSYFLDFNEYSLKRNQIILIYPGQIDYMPDIYSKKGYLFAFEQSLFHEIVEKINSDYLNGYTANTIIDLNDEINHTLNDIMALILKEYNSDYRILLLESYLQAFLFHVSSLYEDHTIKGRDDVLITELMKLIDQHFTIKKEISFYADKLGVTNKKLTKLCIKKTGKTIKQFILVRLLLEAKKEIFKNEKSFKEIAFDLNFSEPAYFTRFFKKHTSMTPDEFRKQMTISPSKRP